MASPKEIAFSRKNGFLPHFIVIAPHHNFKSPSVLFCTAKKRQKKLADYRGQLLHIRQRVFIGIKKTAWIELSACVARIVDQLCGEQCTVEFFQRLSCFTCQCYNPSAPAMSRLACMPLPHVQRIRGLCYHCINLLVDVGNHRYFWSIRSFVVF